MEKALISVVIPVYNVAPYIDRCLESVVAQTYENIEIVVVNDGSTDGTAEIVRRWCEKDGRIRPIDQPNSGVSAARNRALDAIRGEYVAFVDGDDWISPDYISEMYDSLLRHDADMVKCGFRFIDLQNGKTRDYRTGERMMSGPNAIKAFFCGYGISSTVCGGLYKSSLFAEHDLRFSSGVKIGEDGQMTVRLLLNSKNLLVIPSVLYFIRIRRQSASRSGVLISDECKILDNIVLPDTIDEKYKDAYMLRVATSSLLKNALNVSKEEYDKLYTELNYAYYNKRVNRSVLALRWKILAWIGKSERGLFYLAKLLVFCRLKPIF